MSAPPHLQAAPAGDGRSTLQLRIHTPLFGIMILNLSTRKVDVLPVSAGFGILGMNRDPATGVIFGLAGGPGQGMRTVVALHAGNRTIEVVGSVPAYAMQMGGITAYNWVAKSVFWIAQATGADRTSQWLQNAVAGGKTLSYWRWSAPKSQKKRPPPRAATGRRRR